MRGPLMASFLLGLACTGGPAAPAKARPPALVTTQLIALEDVALLVRAPTDLRPIAQADIGAKSVGYLDAVLVDRGDVVKKGQLLALIRPSDLPDQLVAAKNAVALAEAANTLATTNLERAQALAPKGLVSQQEAQSSLSAKAAADAQLGASRANLSALATRLGETRLEAPMEGVVIARRLDPGALVGPTTGAVLTVARVDRLRAFVPVTERRASQVAVGQPARVYFDALGPEPVQGRVERLAPAFDPLTRTLDAEVHLPNDQRRLRPGMYGRAEIEVGVHRAVPVVPAVAVALFEDQAFVYVLDGDVARRRPITLGEDLGDRLEVTSGLSAGDELVVRGIDSLSDGAKVRKAGPGRPDAGVPGRP